VAVKLVKVRSRLEGYAVKEALRRGKGKAGVSSIDKSRSDPHFFLMGIYVKAYAQVS